MKNLKAIRLSKGFTALQIAQFLHIGSSTVCRWELGETKPALCQILQICHVLDCTPAHLFGDYSKDEIIVFDTLNDCIYTHTLTDEMTASKCCFGVVLPYDLSNRFKKSDICFFAADSTAAAGSLVVCCDDNYNEYLHILKGTEIHLQIIASCHVLHTSL